MRVRLMFPDGSFEPDHERFDREDALVQLNADLGLEALWITMSGGDTFLYQMARAAAADLLLDPDTIRYRQSVLADCLAQRDTVSRMYDVAVEALQVERKILIGWHSEKPSARFYRGRTCLAEFVRLLRVLTADAREHGGAFRSQGFRDLFEDMASQLPDSYLDELEECLAALDSRGGIEESVQLGVANEQTGHTLRAPRRARRWRIPTPQRLRHVVTVADRDMAGLDSLADMRERGLAVTAEALAQSADHVKSYFIALRRELGFYLACANLHATLTAAGLPVCMPDAGGPDRVGVRATGLYEPMLVRYGEREVVGSDVAAGDAQLIVITGANQGGKSTFLRALGMAQLMMQCGMFVAAEAYAGGVVDAIYTHFKREEDTTGVSGKLDEELARMSGIVERVKPGSLVLLNESLSSTNEREATVVGADLVEGLLECDVRVRLVTHMYEFAARLSSDVAASAFLRAARLEDGTRSHQIVPGEPLLTSFGADLYEEVFGESLV